MISLQEITWVITILSFVGGIVIFLFKKIVIDPLQNSINALNQTLKEFKLSTDEKLKLHEKEINLLQKVTTRHDEQIKTLFRLAGGEKND